ncbi:MAG: RNA 2',3'-cyclic phosphodiesterase, partial [Betaproteobacteria bacterium]|nr:RNA 2',3'-cyclic phosphodiesterase [Betaproteobacteria bacterium]
MSPAVDSAPPSHTPPEAWRLFFALDPSPTLRRRLASHAAAWRWSPRSRPAAPHKLHLTLLFLTRVDPARVSALLSLGAAAAATHPGCLLWLDRAEVWPGGIAHLAPSTVPAQLQALHDAL